MDENKCKTCGESLEHSPYPNVSNCYTCRLKAWGEKNEYEENEHELCGHCEHFQYGGFHITDGVVCYRTPGREYHISMLGECKHFEVKHK